MKIDKPSFVLGIIVGGYMAILALEFAIITYNIPFLIK